VQIFVFGYDRYDTMSTSVMLSDEAIPHTVLCHTEEAREKFIAAGTAQADQIVATGQPRGLANNRNAALDMMDTGEWALFLVDDLKSVTTVENYDTRRDDRLGITMENQKQIGPKTKEPCPLTDYLLWAEETIAVCESVGAHLGGFCGIANPLFRDAKWRFNVLADGRAWVVKKSSLRFDGGAQLIDDMCWTAQNIERFGAVVVNQWVLPDCKRYTAGSFGSIEERLPQKMQECDYLARTYPALIRIAKKAGWPYGSHVQLKRTLNPKQLRALTTQAHAVSLDWRDANQERIETRTPVV